MIRDRLKACHHSHAPFFMFPAVEPIVPPGVTVTLSWMRSVDCAKWFLQYRFFRDRAVVVKSEYLDAAPIKTFVRGPYFNYLVFVPVGPQARFSLLFFN
jgi:hypothetical protein